MRILLDESIPKGLKRLLEGHESRTVVEQGWSSFSNGKLLQIASQEFDILITADQNLPKQQSLDKHEIAVIVLIAKTNALQDYVPMTDNIRGAVDRAGTEKLQWVTA
ncbi:MAG: DUF5615 family PIN-like protein [Actinobacteria bacterium]|nr:DUF5615 family PIN-like protein [Actinomycetota bacterium]